MKSTYAENSISYLRIKGIGVVSNNPGNGQSLEVDWVGLSFINIADLGHYRPTILEPNPNHIPSILGRIEKVDPDIFKKLSSFLSTTELQDSVNEIFIDIEQQILVGLEVGSEIKDYDVIFLPKSSYEGIGRNGIAAHILQLLNSDRESFRFSDRELKELKFKWDYTDLTNKRVELGFIVSKGEDKNEFDFSKNLQVAINNFQGPIIKDGKINPPVKVFIPMLGTGQAGMSVDNSFEIIKDAIPAIKNQFRNSQIRINFPREIEPAELKRHIKDLLSTHKLQAVDKLNLKIDQLYRRDAESESETNIKDKIPFHLDNVETVDKLNRDPVAESLARLINKDIFDKEEMNHSFMVHLQGEWGSGKSTFLNLIENHLNTKERKWIVIKFNAWQNQHISPPWWSFIDQIYRQSRNAQNWHKKIYLFIRENSRRIIRYSSAYKAFTFSISILLILILFNYGYNIIDFIKNTFNPNDDTAVEDFKLTDISDILVTFSVILGIIIAMAKFFSTPILMNSAEDARSFLKRATNPMAKIKRHFESLISDINFLKYDIAVFIDDIDRCNREYTVELLEGIQTLFKNRKVLYIIAGDTKWITSCFENNYSEFSKVAELQGQNLGELFLEKAFQLSVRMPDVSEESKQAYWKEIIGDKTKTDEEKESYKEVISAVQRERIKQRLVNNYNQNNNSEAERSRIEEEFNISKQQVAELAIEGLDENVTDVRHLLLSFHNLISPNPRSIKRLANNYSMYRNTLIAEDTDFKPGHLFRWLLLEDKYPMVVKHFLESNTLQNLSEFIEKKDSYIDAQIADLNTIIQGRNDSNEEVLKIEELNQILRK
ncbi:MAG TPA: hypothetical protein DEA82_13285 [Flavobacteriaceae bacterium]|nr:hypothetical protein [Flavobacteriaceae bacterium]